MYELPLVKLRGKTLQTSFAIEVGFTLGVSLCRLRAEQSKRVRVVLSDGLWYACDS